MKDVPTTYCYKPLRKSSTVRCFVSEFSVPCFTLLAHSLTPRRAGIPSAETEPFRAINQQLNNLLYSQKPTINLTILHQL